MLILRSAGIGDVAMAAHAVRALRAAYPDLGITIATKKRMPAFFSGIPDLDFIPVDSVGQIVRDARGRGVDLVADLRNELRGKAVRLCMRLSGARTAAYRQEKASRRPLLRHRGKRILWLRNNVLRFCDVFERLGYPVGVPPIPVRASLPLPEVFGTKDGCWVGFAPFSLSDLKTYPEDLRDELVEGLCAAYDRVFLFSGPGEELGYARRLANLHPNLTPVFGSTDLAGEVALMSHLDAVIAMDSAAMHMASLAGAPLVAVWGATHPAVGYSAWGADPDRNYVQMDLPCRPCSVYGEGRCLRADLMCLRGISPAVILSKVASLIPGRDVSASV
jgi:ADP-heptose:LPS heptosyltransferase